jgi:ATP-binding cassette subfamily F protein 3
MQGRARAAALTPMPLLLADDLTLSFGKKTLFDGAGLSIERGDRLGIVGPNGSGKSTLFRILSGQVQPDGGKVLLARGVRIGHLAQEHGDPGDGGLLESLLSAAPGREELEARLRDVEAQLGRAATPDEQLELAADVADLAEQLAALDERFAPHQAQRILVGLGFTQADFDRPLRALSGGWRMRAALAALLFQQPEIMLLDEPTNHLDMSSVQWLGQFLAGVKQAIVLTCHDREFLDRNVRRVASLELEGLRLFRGNYTAYLEQREIELAHLEARARKDEQRKKELEGFVERFKAKASKARQAQSKAKLIEKLESEQVELPEVRRAITLRFPPTERCADQVVRIDGLSFGYADRPVFRDLDLTIRRGDRVAIAGVNGAGKTTLLKLVAGELAPGDGAITLGRNVTLSYFAQHHAEALTPTRTVLDEVWAAAPTLSQTQARSICGAFLFSGDDVEKPVGVLSGGEKARVALARMLAQPGNLLLLDEPTNHLDTESADKLTESLMGYDGTLVFVSHNLDFARRLSTVVWDARDGRVTPYAGSFDGYLELLAAEEHAREASLGGPVAPRSATTPATPALDDRSARREHRERLRQEESELRKRQRDVERRLGAIEAEIATLEGEQAALETTLADPSTHQDPRRSRECALRLESVKEQLAGRMETWATLAEEREQLTPRAEG